MAPILITLDGNIGAGKSTLLEALRSLPYVTVIPEPVGTWLNLKNEHGESLLSLFYKDQTRWSYTFQNCAVLTRLSETKKILQTHADGIIITERSVLTDRHVFAEMLYKQGKMDELEWKLYNMWFDYAKEYPYKGIIYLTTNPDTSAKRIAVRGREGETIAQSYLEDLDAAHKQWIDTSDLPVCRVSTDGSSMEDAVKIVDAWLKSNFVE